MMKLRGALMDSPDDPRYLETIPGVGYRFISDVRCEWEPEVEAPPGDYASVSDGDSGHEPFAAAVGNAELAQIGAKPSVISARASRTYYRLAFSAGAAVALLVLLWFGFILNGKSQAERLRTVITWLPDHRDR
jgi:hypothetical protein